MSSAEVVVRHPNKGAQLDHVHGITGEPPVKVEMVTTNYSSVYRTAFVLHNRRGSIAQTAPTVWLANKWSLATKDPALWAFGAFFFGASAVLALTLGWVGAPSFLIALFLVFCRPSHDPIGHRLKQLVTGEVDNTIAVPIDAGFKDNDLTEQDQRIILGVASRNPTTFKPVLQSQPFLKSLFLTLPKLDAAAKQVGREGEVSATVETLLIRAYDPDHYEVELDTICATLDELHQVLRKNYREKLRSDELSATVDDVRHRSDPAEVKKLVEDEVAEVSSSLSNSLKLETQARHDINDGLEKELVNHDQGS